MSINDALWFSAGALFAICFFWAAHWHRARGPLRGCSGGDTGAERREDVINEIEITDLLAECRDWLEGRRSWCNLGPHEPYTPDVITRMDAAEIDKRAAMIRALKEAEVKS